MDELKELKEYAKFAWWCVSHDIVTTVLMLIGLTFFSLVTISVIIMIIHGGGF